MCLCPVSPDPQQRQETNKSPPPPLLFVSRSLPLLPCPRSVLFTVFTHHLHLSKKPFKLLEVESRATVGGAAAGSLAEPEHSVQHLRDTGSIYKGQYISIEDKGSVMKGQQLRTFFILRLQSLMRERERERGVLLS